MRDFQFWLYILIGVIYLLTRFFKKPAQQPTDVPDFQPEKPVKRFEPPPVKPGGPPSKTLTFEELLKDPSRDPEEIAIEKNLFQQSDLNTLEPIIDRVLEKYADKVKEYRKGKKGVLSLFVGEVMKQSKGKADPKLTNQLILEKLKS